MKEYEDKVEDLIFIKKAYENLVENGAEHYRAVGKEVDSIVEVKTDRELYIRYIDALQVAIQAVLEVQKYKEIGTVEECKEAMDIALTKEIEESYYRCYKGSKDPCELCNDNSCSFHK